nr:2-C-methyl-D-erythritol 4-phosphate cytidylyltransferase [Rhodocyclaceae bacterium]
MSYYALVPAAGSGSRMNDGLGSSAPKQYLPLADRPMVLHSLL